MKCMQGGRIGRQCQAKHYACQEQYHVPDHDRGLYLQRFSCMGIITCAIIQYGTRAHVNLFNIACACRCAAAVSISDRPYHDYAEVEVDGTAHASIVKVSGLR